MFLTTVLLTLVVSSVNPYVVTWTNHVERPETSRSLLGASNCIRGPSYWCYNITQAKECQAVRHCIQRVWEKMQVPEDNDSVCQVCKDMVQQARDQLLSNETQDELRQVLEGSCNLIPLKPIAKECDKLADEFIPELVDTLTSRMDPDVVCTVSGLCNSARIDAMLKAQNARLSDEFDIKTDSCPKCNYYFGKSIDFLQAMPESILANRIRELCGRLGSFSDACSSLVLRHRDEIYDHVQHQMNSKDMCALVGLCEMNSLPTKVNTGGSSTAVRVWAPPPNADNLTCDFCKQVVTNFKDWLVANTTRGEFQNLVIGVCKRLKKSRQECLDFANKYGKPLYQLLVDESDPDLICGAIGICPKQGKFQVLSDPIWTFLPIQEEESKPDVQHAAMLSLRPAERLAGDDEISNRPNALQKGSQKGQRECQFCEYTLLELQQYIENPRTEASIRKAIDKLCAILPEKMSAQCIQFVNVYSDSVVAYLAQDLDPTQICDMVQACKPTKVVGESLLPFDRFMPRAMLKGELARVRAEHPELTSRLIEPNHGNVWDENTCILCEFVLTKLDKRLSDNATVEEVTHAVEHICNFLPKTVKEQCRDFVDTKGEMVIDYLANSVNPREICTKLRLCQQGATIVSANKRRKVL